MHRETRIPQEAIIGIVYAVSAAASILVMSKAPQETEHLKDMLVGNMLAVNWSTVIKTAVLYAAIGLFHYIFRRSSWRSRSPRTTARRRRFRTCGLWDFLFYASFGLVVTWSVAIAGVLLVFCYLIVPSVAAMLFASSIGKRLALGWIIAAVVTALGIFLSFKIDLPTGATIVVHIRRRAAADGDREDDREAEAGVGLIGFASAPSADKNFRR